MGHRSPDCRLLGEFVGAYGAIRPCPIKSAQRHKGCRSVSLYARRSGQRWSMDDERQVVVRPLGWAVGAERRETNPHGRMTIQPCPIKIWRTDRAGCRGVWHTPMRIGLSPLRQPNRVIAGGRFAATASVTLKGFAAAVGRMPYAPTPAVRLGNFNRTGLYGDTPPHHGLANAS